MRSIVMSLFACLTLVACGGSDDDNSNNNNITTDTGIAPTDTGTPSTDSGGTPDDTGTTETDSGAIDTGTDSAPSCTSARDTALKPVDKTSTGDVTTLATTGDVTTFYVDASAGGSAMAASNPWIYLDLATATRVAVTDKESFAATNWDLAIKRPIFRTNSGDSGAGAGGAVFLKGKAFDALTDAEAKAAAPVAEDWFDDTCTLKTDPTGAIKTTFDGWYEYDTATMKLTPAAGTWIVRGAKGALYKLEIGSYYSNPDGSVGATSARYKLRVAAVK